MIALLQQRAATGVGREFCAQITPVSDIDFARRLLQQTDEALALLDREGGAPFGGITDIRQVVNRASVGSILQPSELYQIAATLQSIDRLRKFFHRPQSEYPLLRTIAGDIQTSEPLQLAVMKAISASGEVLDAASHALAAARSELRTTQSRIVTKLESMLGSKQYKTAIQEPVITMRSDRYCIPIKADFRGQVPGIVHDTSSSGATLFIEPAALVDLGNRRRELTSKERDEVEKVLAGLSVQVQKQADIILSNVDLAAQLDCVFARAKLAAEQSATLPALNDKGKLNVSSARHPLIGANAVPISYRLGSGFNALLITGPNTGGKTVALKTIGLLALMAASGLFVPANVGAEIALFKKVFADIGDEQSIEQSLSTFSSHMSNIVRITQNADQRSLVLLDELGAGTDPAEGSALAKSVLDHLLRRGAKIVATTHYGELKEYAYARDGIENASVEFDLETLRPTYKLMIGIPGGSNAFAIAERLGLSKEIVQEARESCSSCSEQSDELIRRLEESTSAVAAERKETSQTLAEVETLKQTYQSRINAIAAAEAEVKTRTRERAQAIIDSYAKRLDETLEELSKQQCDSQAAQNLRTKVQEIIQEAREETDAAEPELPETPLEEGSSLAPGTLVRVMGINQDGEIIGPVEDGKVPVMIGSMRITVGLSALRQAKGQKRTIAVAEKPGSAIALEKAREVHSEISLRGKRVEPALLELDKYLDDAAASGIPRVRIVHGKGTGVMRQAVSQYLKSHPMVASSRIGEASEGGAGVTVVDMKR